MKFLVNMLKDTKLGYIVKRNSLLKAIVKSIYKFFMFPFTRRGIDVKIGGLGAYRLDYNFALRDYENFGGRHNRGFRKWTECCKGKKTIFDIGAHIGLYTLPASSVIAADGAVYAFEPSLANRRYLKRHIEYNNIHNVVLFPYIVGEEEKTGQIFYESRRTDPMNSLFPKKNINLYSRVYRNQISLDDFAGKANLKPDVIKIDVEGSECNVLKGARRIIEGCKPIIFLSVHPKQLTLFKSSIEELKRVIDSLGYVIRDWDGRELNELAGLKEYILTPAHGGQFCNGGQFCKTGQVWGGNNAFSQTCPDLPKMGRILRKNLNIIKDYGIQGSFLIYIRGAMWHLCHLLSGESAKYIKVKVNPLRKVVGNGVDNYEMFVNLKDKGISKALYIYGDREKDEMYIIKNNLKRGANILDIGANIGYYLILESRIIGPSARIIAYEPSEENCVLLRKNIELNGLTSQVEINNAAVSDKSGVARFYLSDESNLHTLSPERYKTYLKTKELPESVDVATVDIYEIIEKNRDIGFIRMDIEGHEVEVLGGIARAVRDFGVYPDILFEAHYPKYHPVHHDIGDRLKKLFGLGYFSKVVVSDNKRIPEFKKRGYEPEVIITTDRVNRAVYEGVSKEDTIDFISNVGGIRAVLLKRK